MAKAPSQRWRGALELLEALHGLSSRPTEVDPAEVRVDVGVLPFRSTSDDPEIRSLAEGIGEELTARLSVAAAGRVVAWQRMLALASEVDVREVGALTGAAYLVQGSLRVAGERIRVAVQLVEAASGVQLWAERFDGTRGDVFDLQDEIADDIFGALMPRVHELDQQAH